MKKIICFITATALAASGSAFGQAYTAPSGYVSLGNTAAGVNNVEANTDVVVSIPMLRSAAYVGSVGSVTATTVTVKGTPSFATNTWTSSPHVLVIGSGSESGLIAPILSNTANTLTINSGIFSTTGILADDKLSIRPAWTIGTFMFIMVQIG